MPRRSTVFEDLMEVASRLPWRVGVVLAILSGVFLHLSSIVVGPPQSAPPDISAFGSVAARGLFGGVLRLLQFVIPPAFLIGAVVSCFRGRQAKELFWKAREHGAAGVEQMTWSQFERLVAEAFRRRGYAVAETGRRGPDGGVDLVLTLDGERILVQCKQWRTQKVGVGVVRELYGVIAAEGAAGGYVVTSGTFTHEAREFASTCRIELLDGGNLEALIREVEQKRAHEAGLPSANPPVPKAIKSTVVDPTCPACGSSMLKRVARRGRSPGDSFWGCSRFPRCRGTRALEV